MPKNTSDIRVYYTVAVEYTELFSNETKMQYLMTNDDNWVLSDNVGDAFMFFKKEVAMDFAREIPPQFAEMDGCTLDHVYVFTLEVKVHEVTEIEF